MPTQPLKIGAFAVSVAITAMIGGVWGYYLTFIMPQYAIDPLMMVGIALTAFLGGKGTLWGPTIGALIVVPAQQYLAFRVGASDLYLVSYAAIFLIVILLLPRGVVPTLGERLRARRAPVPPLSGRSQPMSPAAHPPLLDARALRRSFGGVHAVRDCGITVEPHTITGLIGPNGSGKTTAFNIITGYLAAHGGEVVFDGARHRRPDPRRLHRAGLSRTFQQARVFPELTVLENLVVAARRDVRALFGPRVTAADREQAMSMLE